MSKIKTIKELEKEKSELSTSKKSNEATTETPKRKIVASNAPTMLPGDEYYTAENADHLRPSGKRDTTPIEGSASVSKRGLVGINDQDTINEYESIKSRSVLPSMVKLGAKGFLNLLPGVNLDTQNEVNEFGNAVIDKRTKEQLVNDYNEAKNRQIESALNNYTPQDANTLPMLAGVNYTKIFQRGQYKDAMNEIAPYLAENNITPAQVEDYYRKQVYAEQNRKAEENALENPFLYNLSTYVTSPIGKAGVAANAVKSLITGEPLAANQSLNEYAKLAPTIRQTIGEDIEWNTNSELEGKAKRLLYDTANSIGDMGMSLALGGGNQAASLALMSTGAGADTLTEQMGKDTTDAQKLATALSSGIVEALTEKIPLDNLFKVANNTATKQTVKQIIGNALKQAGQEATEEAVSEIVNAVFDNAINGAQSDYQQTVQAYMSQGMNEIQASKKARMDIAGNAVYSALAGALSGGIMGTGASVVGNMNVDANYRNDVASRRMLPQANERAQVRKILPYLDMAQNEQESVPAQQETLPTIEQIVEDQAPVTEQAPAQEQIPRIEIKPDTRTSAQREAEAFSVFEDVLSEEEARKQSVLTELNKYSKEEINGFKDLTKPIKDAIKYYGKDNELVKQKYVEAIQNINKYLESYDQSAINAAMDALSVIDEQLTGKTNTFNGKTYGYEEGSILDNFVANSKNLYNMARHNALGEELPILQQKQSVNYTTLNNATEAYGDETTQKQLGEFKKYIDRYIEERDPALLDNAMKVAEAIDASLIGKTYKKGTRTITFKKNNITNAAKKIVDSLKNEQKNANELPKVSETAPKTELVEEKMADELPKFYNNYSDDEMERLMGYYDDPNVVTPQTLDFWEKEAEGTTKELEYFGRPSIGGDIGDSAARVYTSLEFAKLGYNINSDINKLNRTGSLVDGVANIGNGIFDDIHEYISRGEILPSEYASLFDKLAKNEISLEEFDDSVKSLAKQGRERIEAQSKKQPKPKKQREMAEDIGLGKSTTEPGENNVNIKINENDNGATLTQEVFPSGTSQFATNSLAENIAQTEEGREKVQEGIEAGDYNKGVNATNKVDVLGNAETEERARRMIQNNREELEDKIRRGEVDDPVVFEAVIQLTEEAEAKQDWDAFRYYSMKASGQSTDAGRILQLLAKRAKRTGATAVQKADALIGEMTDIVMNSKNNKSKREGCAKLATALRNIGNDHTNDTDSTQPKTYQQIRNGVLAELNRESSSVFDRFTDDDIDYMARMVERGYSAKDIQYRLEEKLATGSWEISDADIAEVVSLFNQAEKYGDRSLQRMELEEKAYAILSKYLPEATFMDKWNAWRYLSMLGNTRTHIRNVVGNLMFGTVTDIKDAVAGTLESALIRDPSKRTKSAFNQTSLELRQAARADADNVWLDLTEGGNKYDMQREIENQRRIFKNAGLEWLRNFNNDMLTREDNAALRRKYGKALAGYLQAHGKDASIFRSQNEADIDLLEEARDYAIQQAKIATFHEENEFASYLSKISREAQQSKTSLGKRAFGYGIEALVPFKKTPVNILKQGVVAYNPLQVVHALYDAIQNGDNPSKAIDELARGLTGSGIMALGYALASSGILRPSNSEDDDLDKLSGEQEYSINLGDHSYTVDWAAPAALPLFVGAELYKAFEDREDFDFWSAVSSVSDPVIEMSMLQGLKNSLESVASFTTGKNTFGDAAINTAYNYASQGLPTLMGQVARSVDDTRRSTYTGEQGTMDTLIRNARKAANKIPGLSMLNEPYVNAWGETQENTGGNVLGRLAYNMLSPGYYSNTAKSETEQELYRLNDLMKSGSIENSKIIPGIADKSYDGQKLSPSEYTEFSRIKGQTLQTLYKEAMNNPKYENLSDESKAELIADIQKFGNALSKSEMFDYDIAGSDSYKKKYQAYQNGGVDGLITYMQLMDSRNGSKVGDTIAAIESQNLSDAEKAYYFKQLNPTYSKKAQYLDSINEKYAYDWYKIQSENGTGKDEMIFGIYTSNLPEEEKQKLLEVVGMDNDTLTFYLLTGQQ